jgi:hypothetical protein
MFVLSCMRVVPPTRKTSGFSENAAPWMACRTRLKKPTHYEWMRNQLSAPA